VAAASAPRHGVAYLCIEERVPGVSGMLRARERARRCRGGGFEACPHTPVGAGRQRGAVDDRELVGHYQRRPGDLRRAPQLGVALGHLRCERHRRLGSVLSRGSRGPRRSGGGVQSHGNARKVRVARGMGGEHTWCGLNPQHEQELLEHEVELVHARAHLTCRRATHAFMQVRIRSRSRRKRYEAQGAWLASE
jgi:hypothetical protein